VAAPASICGSEVLRLVDAAAHFSDADLHFPGSLAQLTRCSDAVFGLGDPVACLFDSPVRVGFQ
jgi:hypothetical protein